MKSNKTLECLGKKITNLKIQKGLITEELAENIDIARSTLWSIERGKTDPKLSTIMKITDYFDIELNEFFTFTN